MSRYLPYSPDQAYLLPPNVKDELGEEHLCFWVHRVVERLDLGEFEKAYSEEGGALYAPALMLKVWLYGYALGITSARRLEQRIREDLGLRYLAGGQQPDNWALSAFRRRHGRALNDSFTQVLEQAREWEVSKLGTVAIDSTRIRAQASRDRINTEQRLRNERARLRRQIRHWSTGETWDWLELGAATAKRYGTPHLMLHRADLHGVLANAVHRLKPDAVHLAKRCVGIAQSKEHVEVVFADGARVSADYLVGADGIRSTVRQQYLPEVTPQYAGYTAWRALIAEDFRKAFAEVDAIVAPVSPSPAFKIGEKIDDPLEMYLSDIYTITGDLAGIPCMSVPCGKTSEGFPVGMQILTRHFDETGMFRLADAFEKAGGFAG